ncbi:DPP IV N-terminal domain-containing protein [Cryobacterium sp. SO2]|uniref:DPP IV N-terminal domain-containing protein n=1 Tax=Cryobacterium sp. SO2 TaxID=1897060 RepID=UPI00223D467A|nr:DPP IV N-terminal domain-containing protein [Cryobacterium sp. SO2]WEO78707.1 DPP IV N-terminal domain-containing protein [Cryobacterium sp. SO2]
MLPGEEWIVYQYGTPCGLSPSDPSTICLVRPDGTGRHPLPTSETGEAVHPDWSPDGSRLTYVIHNEIWVTDVDGGNQKAVASCSQDDCLALDYPAWSPDGSRIAFTRYTGPPLGGGPPSSSAIDIVDVESRAVTTATQTDRLSLVDQARWSPTGDQLVVQLEQFTPDGTETGAAIAIVPTAGGTPTPITNFDLVATYPDWNPRSDSIVFASHDVDTEDEPVQLFTVNADGSGLTPLVFDGAATQRSVQPSWTPDGQQIIFVEWENRATSLINPDGTSLQTLTTFRASHPRLRPLTD